MFEKVNPSHPDKVADRIAGALVDLAYKKSTRPKIAAEVLIGHGVCHIIIETSEAFTQEEIAATVHRIAGDVQVDAKVVQQDAHLAANQDGKIRCGDNGIFKGMPVTNEQKLLSGIARDIYKHFPYDGKYIIDEPEIKSEDFVHYEVPLTICQSHMSDAQKRAYPKKLQKFLESYLDKSTLSAFFDTRFAIKTNPLGEWAGGIEVDTGATNRKLGSDMGDAVTGGGLHGKDLSKADVSVNIFCHLEAQIRNHPVNMRCSIGDEYVGFYKYEEIVERARKYIESLGGFEKFAEWGLI